MLLDGMHHPRRSTPDDRACPARRPRRNSLVSLHESLRQAGLPARRGSARPQGVDRASARRTCSSLRASCQSSAIQGSRLDSFVASRFALSHDFPPAQAPNFRRFAAHSVKWAVGQFGTIPALFSPRCLHSARVSMAANEVLARVAADRGSRRIRDQPRNPPKSTEERIRINSPFSTPPFCVRRCFPWLPVCDDLSCRSNTASIPTPS